MVQQLDDAREPGPRTRVRAENRYPVYDLDSVVAMAMSIRDDGGGRADHPHLASYLNYSGTNNGAFLHRIAAARLFGLVEKSGKYLVLTPLANRILAPEHPGEDDLRARHQAFMNVPLYRQLYDRYQSGPLPPEAGLRNAFETHYGVPRARTQRAYRVFMGSADQAGLFRARGGARTHLVAPAIPAPDEDTSAEEWAQTQPPEQGEIRGELAQPVPQAQMQQPNTIRRLRQALVEKIREVPADDLDKIREYIKEIKELGELEKLEGEAD